MWSLQSYLMPVHCCITSTQKVTIYQVSDSKESPMTPNPEVYLIRWPNFWFPNVKVTPNNGHLIFLFHQQKTWDYFNVLVTVLMSPEVFIWNEDLDFCLCKNNSALHWHLSYFTSKMSKLQVKLIQTCSIGHVFWFLDLMKCSE